MKSSLFPRLASALATTDIGQKLTLTAAVAADWRAGHLDWQDLAPLALSCGIPERPELIHPGKVPTRNPKSPEGRARLLHAIVHIEFSAIKFGFNECKERYFAFAA